jgi:hypothetical protein
MNSLIRSVAAVVALMVVSLVHAAELVVPTQYPSIQAAINASVTGDIITVRPGTYNERLDIGGRNITLRSLLGPNATIIDPQGVGGVVIQSTNAAANGWVLQGFTIRNGLDSALYVSGVTATVRNCKFINNQASRGGGAHIRAGANVTFENCEFTQNKASSGGFLGGACYFESCTASVLGCLFQSNQAIRPNGGYGSAAYFQRGGAIHVQGATIQLADCVSRENSAVMNYENGSCFNGLSHFLSYGGFLSAVGGQVTIDRHQSQDDEAYVRAIDTAGQCGDRAEYADPRGGFAHLEGDAALVIRDSTVLRAETRSIGQGGCCYYNDVYPWGWGGAFYASGAALTIERCTFDSPGVVRTWQGGSGGPAEASGGFIYHSSGVLSIVDSVIRGATAPDFGAIRTVTSGGLSISGSRFENCVSGNTGGAISSSTAAPFTVSGTTFIGCRSDAANGGAIWLTGGTRNFTNCTFTNNIAQGGGDHRGGAIYAEGGAQLNFTDCGFTGNRALSTGDNADRWTWGGACAMFGVTPRYTRCNFTDNAAISTGNGGGWRRAHGGATAEYDSDAVFTDCVFTNNRTEAVGDGAQWSRGGTVHLWNSDSDFVRTTISDGRALPLTGGSSGGGVWMENVSRPGFTYCTITDCDANEGAGLYVSSSEPYFVSTAFRRNAATTQGGAMLVDAASTPYVLECEFEQNTAPQGGAVRTLGSGTNLPFIVNSSFCGNTADAINGSILGGEGNLTTATCSADCNGNGTPDAEEIAAGAADVDTNGILDSCQTDCNANGLPDAYELGQNTASDCNGNGTPDSCDIASGLSGDANTNGVPDECELASARLVPFEYASITAAINAAQSGDTIFLAPGAYYEKFSFGNKQLTLKSVGGAAVTYIDGNGQNGTLLTINGGQTTASVVDGITFWYAQGGYALYVQNASPTVRNCRFLFNQVGDGAAFRIEAPSSAEIFDCLVEANTAYSTGGGLWTNTSPIFTRTMFKDNLANGSGGAARLQGGSARFVDCDFVGNRAQGGGDHRGGAVSASSTVNASFASCTFVSNLATSNGDHADRVAIGGACAFNDCVFSGANPPRTFVDCLFEGNIARATGNHGGTRVAVAGAVYDYNSDLRFTGCTFDDNRAESTSNAGRRSWGGAYYATLSAPDIDACILTANACVSNDGGESLGGAIYYEGATNGFVDNTMFEGNSARRGGALYLTGNSQPNFATCDFVSNTGSERGGAVYANVAPAFFFECSFRENSTPASGGGLMYVEGTTGPIVYGSFLCGNSTPLVVGNWGDFKNTILSLCSDCNANGVDDAIDISSGGSADCDGNGTPDECEVDSDGDGAIDACDGCPTDPAKIEPGACGCGVAETDSDLDGTPDCADGCPSDPLKTDPGACGCGSTESDTDSDGTPDCTDGCPTDPSKTSPGTCGCGVADTDSDSDGAADCNDGCPSDPLKTAPGVCGCGVADTDSDSDGTPDCNDGCPSDPLKTAPGTCGCGVADTDSDSDGTPDCNDGCPSDPLKTDPGVCGCGVADTDSDSDGTPDCNDGCPSDPLKTEPGTCGCGVADTDSDSDGTPDCNDGCPLDPLKTDPGICGCGVADTDSDSDATPDCNDGCPSDPLKTAPGVCGCGVADTDSDSDGTPDCNDGCPSDPLKTEPGVCGCGVAETDSDSDGSPDCSDGCPLDPLKTAPGACGCGVADTDSDSDGTPDCTDGCPLDPLKTAPGMCGCGVADTDSDSDGTPDCTDSCPLDPLKTAPGACGCGVADTDSDSDGTPDCNDGCPSDPLKTAPGACGCGTVDTDSDGDTVADCVDNCPATANPSQADCDSNGVGDVCAGEFDCNSNGVPDSCDLNTGTSTDLDGSGVPDDCEAVVGGSGYPTIQAAVDASPSGTIIRVAPGTYTEAVLINSKVIHLRAIEGLKAIKPTILSGTGLDRSILTIRTAAAAGSTVTGFRFVDGTVGTAEFGTRLGGAILMIETTASVSDCEFTGNASNYGGAIYAFKHSGVIERCLFEDNHSIEDSGAVQLGFGGTFVFRQNTLRGNSSGRNGGGLQVVSWFDGPITTGSIVDCVFDGNTAVGEGGALAWYGGAGPSLFVDHCRVTANTGQAAAFAKLVDSGVNELAFAVSNSYFCLNSPANITGPLVDLGGNDFGDDCDSNGVCDLDEIWAGAPDANGNGELDVCEQSRGDLDLDGIVGGGDLAILLSSWGGAGGTVGDLNGDGQVSAEDLALLLSFWGT